MTDLLQRLALRALGEGHRVRPQVQGILVGPGIAVGSGEAELRDPAPSVRPIAASEPGVLGAREPVTAAPEPWRPESGHHQPGAAAPPAAEEPTTASPPVALPQGGTAQGETAQGATAQAEARAETQPPGERRRSFRTSEPLAPAALRDDPRAQELRAPDLRAPDLRAPHQPAPHHPSPDLAAPDPAAPDLAAPDREAPDTPTGRYGPSGGETLADGEDRNGWQRAAPRDEAEPPALTTERNSPLALPLRAQAAAGWRAAGREAREEAVIQVTIGRVEIRAARPAPSAAPPAARPAPAAPRPLSLDAYLRDRKGSGR